MDLLTNAIESIRVGVEDFQIGTRRRLLSAVRNIHSGVLLLFKEVLRRRSPEDSDEVLVKAKSLPVADGAGVVRFVGVGSRTVDVQQIRERFESLGIAVDWKRFEEISRVRNSVEHYYPELASEALHGLISNTLELVRHVIARVLDADPRESLGPEAWQAMLNVAEVHAAEQNECARFLDDVAWDSATLSDAVRELKCQGCGSQLLRPEQVPEDGVPQGVRLRCRKCGVLEAAQSFVPRAIEAALGSEMYLVKEGGEVPYVPCPECGVEAYVIEEQRCAFCGHEAEHKCVRCGNTIPPEELDTSPLCGWCAHMVAKESPQNKIYV